jgi:Uma2 family endonuclease
MTLSQSNSTTQRMTLEEYLAYDDGTDTRYEWVDGVLTVMPTESPENLLIATFLLIHLAQMGINPYYLGMKHQIAVQSTKVLVREPDLTVHSEASAIALFNEPQSLLRFDAPAPRLVVEVVSPGEPGTANYNRDYLEKPQEYAARGIPEFWRVDPARAIVQVLTLADRIYQVRDFTGTAAISSPSFPTLNLTAAQLLKASY